MNGNKEKLNKILFVVFNIVLIIICIVVMFFVLKYKNDSYEKHNPLLYKVINNTTEDDKYMAFKGDVKNNYIKYNNLLWRIIKINSSGSITIILDNKINILPWQIGSDFSLNEYLNTEFKDELDTSKLTNNNGCKDDVTELDSITCKNITSEYVSLLDLNSYLTTLDNGNTFIGENSENIWLYNKYDNKKSWHVNGDKLGVSSVDALYEVRPVVTLNNNVLYETGDGTKTNPYLISSDNLSIGSTVKIDNDLYEVYSTSDDIKLALKDTLKKYKYTGNVEDILSYLEKEFYNKLSYKDMLSDAKNVIVDVSKSKVTNKEINSKVGTYNMFDFKVNNDNLDYYMLSKLDNYILVYNNDVIYGTKDNYHDLVPTISIKKDKMKGFKLVDGIYVLGDV